MYFYRLCIKYGLIFFLIVQLLVIFDQPRNLSLLNGNGVSLNDNLLPTISAVFERVEVRLHKLSTINLLYSIKTAMRVIILL